MFRHLETVHKDELSVQQVLSLKKGSRERRQAWGHLLKTGDYEHNVLVIESGIGTITPAYRTKHGDTSGIVPCPNCKAMYKKRNIGLHYKRCSGSPNKDLKNRLVKKKGMCLLPVPKKFSAKFWSDVMLSMKDDLVAKTVKNDVTIVEYGKRLFNKRDVEEHTANNVSQKMREMGRLLIEVRNQSNNQINTMKSMINPAHFDIVVNSTRVLAGYNENTHMYQKGSLALKMGYSLKKIALNLQAEAKKQFKPDDQKLAEDFHSVISSEWCDEVSSTANQSLEREKFNKPDLQPACNDVAKLYSYVKDHNGEDYRSLARATLCEVSLFNRKRGGEVQRMTVEHFKNGIQTDSNEPDQEIMDSLCEVEKKLVHHFKRIEIRGKFNRRVPILLTKSMIDKINKLLELRQLLNIESQYLFASPQGDRPYRGTDVIRDLAQEAGIQNLNLFTCTSLRKQVATLAQTMEITETQQDQLASFLGHDFYVHRKFYRLPLNIVEKTKVAQILMKANNETFEQEQTGVKTISNGAKQIEEEKFNCHLKSSPSCKISVNCDESRDNYPDSTSDMIGKTKEKFKNKGKWKKWTDEEQNAVSKHFNANFLMGKAPGKNEIIIVLEKEQILKGRSWSQIKHFILNRIRNI